MKMQKAGADRILLDMGGTRYVIKLLVDEGASTLWSVRRADGRRLTRRDRAAIDALGVFEAA
jgi:hypothetical protein